MKTDHILGKQIQKLLFDHNLENPIMNHIVDNWNNNDYQLELQDIFQQFLIKLGLDLNNHSIINTPKRVIEFFIKELFYGLDYKNFPKISLNPNSFNYHTPIISKAITVRSTCEHHLVSINGSAVIAYIPSANIVGLSKLNRVVDFFARRPQVQERLTRQILVTLQNILQTENVAVAINASHNCIVIRGVENPNSETLTMELGGEFLSNVDYKNMFLNLSTQLTI